MFINLIWENIFYNLYAGLKSILSGCFHSCSLAYLYGHMVNCTNFTTTQNI